jgi:hypothetical protein
MTFSRVKALGWAMFEVLTSAQMNALDIDHANAVDGAAGGSYAPGAQIVVGGAGLRVTGTFEAHGSSIVLGDSGLDGLLINAEADFQNGFQVGGAGNATFNRDVICNENVTLGLTAADFVTVKGIGVFQQDCDFAGNTTFNTASFSGGVTLGNAAGDNIVVSGTFTANEGATFTKGARFDDPVTFQGNGRIRYRTQVFTLDQNETITPETADVFYIGDGIHTAPRSWTVDDTNCANGDWFIAINRGLTHALTVRDPAANPISGGLKLAAGSSLSQMFMRIGGAWTGLIVGNVL